MGKMTTEQKLERLKVVYRYMELSLINFGEIALFDSTMETLERISDGTLDDYNAALEADAEARRERKARTPHQK